MAAKKSSPKPKPRRRPPPAPRAAKRRAAKPKPHSSGRKPPFVVGIGASAGGLEALLAFFRNMPSDSGMVFVVVTHQQPDHASLLPNLLSKATQMKVVPASEAAVLQPDTVHVGVPGKYLAILKGSLQLMDAQTGPDAQLPIDYFFRSLAQDQEDRAICVVLSGTGTDGTLGLRAIKACAGMVIVQDERSAQYAGMPHSAAATLLVDHVLRPDQMPQQLLAYAGKQPQRAPEPESEAELSGVLAKLFVLLRSRTGHDFSSYKRNTIERRVARRMRIHQLVSADDYLRLAKARPHELDLLFQELLITVTQFFRDPASFEALATTLSKRIASNPDRAPFRVWVPGCSTGEEAYSIAMLVNELSVQLGKRVQLQVFATDINPQTIDLARSGWYPKGIAADVGSERLRSFFAVDGSGYRIDKQIRDCIVFATQDVVRDPPFTRLDLLSCRNLLIYLNAELQQRLLPLFHYALRPAGTLWLGSSETANNYSDLFEVLDRKWKIYERRKSGATVVPRFALRLAEQGEHAQQASKVDAPPSGFANAMKGLLLDRFAPATLVVNHQGDIAYIHGRTGAYLEPSPGAPRHNVFAMAREGLRLALQSAVRTAGGVDREVVQRSIPVRTRDGVEPVDLMVQRISEPEALRGLFRVSFASASSQRTGKKRAVKKGVRQPQVAKELLLTQDSLQQTLGELQTSNEELKSSNEELQSTNEELQSTNEELETSKEELQSLNEELQTVNVELQLKNDELAQVNDDMQNLLNGTEIATLFLDRELRIKRFTEQARRVVRLISTDVGRPIGDLVRQVHYDRLSEDAIEVLRTLKSHEAEAQALDGRWLLVRILPYRTSQDRIEGVVITFVDIDRVKRAESLAASRELAESVVQTVRAPLLVLDTDLRAVTTNRAFLRLLQLEEAEVRGASIFDLARGVFALPALRTLLESLLTRGVPIEAFEFSHQFEGGVAGRLQLNARRLEPQGVASGHVLLALQPISSGDTSLSP